MSKPFNPVVPFLLGNAAAGVAGSALRKFSHTFDTRYISGAPTDTITPSMPRGRSGTKVMRRSFRRRTRRRFRSRRRRYGTPWGVVRRVRTVCYWSPTLAAGGGIQTAQLKLNSVNDPTGTISTTHPLTGAEWSSLYKKYQVLGYTLKVEVVSSDNTFPIVVGFTPLSESTPLTAYAHYMEMNGTVSRMCTMDVDKTVLFHRSSIGKYLSNSRRVLGDDTLQSVTSSDPARLLYGHLFAQVVDAAADGGSIQFIITLNQVVKYFDPVTVART